MARYVRLSQTTYPNGRQVTGNIKSAANASASPRECGKDCTGVEIVANFVATAGELSTKEGGSFKGGIGGKVGGKDGEPEGSGSVEGGGNWEVGRTNQGFTVQPWAKYRLCPDGKGSYTVKLLSTGGVGIGKDEGQSHGFQDGPWRYLFHSVLTHISAG